MSNPAVDVIRIRHVVSIAGAVQDAVAHRRIAGALIEIIAGPPAYQAALAAISADPAWQRRRDRPDRATSQRDGIFHFVDLPPGPYRLRVSVPELGSRCGVVEIGPLPVQPAPDDGPFPVARADVDLPPTRIHGTLTQKSSGDPLPGARVRLLGDTTVVKTRDDGTYELNWQLAGKPTLQVTAPGFRPATRQVALAVGKDRVANFALLPE